MWVSPLPQVPPTQGRALHRLDRRQEPGGPSQESITSSMLDLPDLPVCCCCRCCVCFVLFFIIKFRLNIFGKDTDNVAQITFLLSNISGSVPTSFHPHTYQRPQGSYFTSFKIRQEKKFVVLISWLQSHQDISWFEWAPPQGVPIRGKKTARFQILTLALRSMSLSSPCFHM